MYLVKLSDACFKGKIGSLFEQDAGYCTLSWMFRSITIDNHPNPIHHCNETHSDPSLLALIKIPCHKFSLDGGLGESKDSNIIAYCISTSGWGVQEGNGGTSQTLVKERAKEVIPKVLSFLKDKKSIVIIHIPSRKTSTATRYTIEREVAILTKFSGSKHVSLIKKHKSNYWITIVTGSEHNYKGVLAEAIKCDTLIQTWLEREYTEKVSLEERKEREKKLKEKGKTIKPIEEGKGPFISRFVANEPNPRLRTGGKKKPQQQQKQQPQKKPQKPQGGKVSNELAIEKLKNENLRLQLQMSRVGGQQPRGKRGKNKKE